MADTIPNVDRNLATWRGILKVACDSGNLAEELEAREEIDRLLELRFAVTA